MTLQECINRKRAIHTAVYTDDDPEQGTSLERKLWRDLLRSIADGTCQNPQEVATAAVVTAEWSFRRMN
jgi:hypothetical protein